MSSKLFFKFFSRNGYTELHVSRKKEEVEQGKALSRKVPHNSPLYDKVVRDMEDEVEFWLNDVRAAEVLPPEGFKKETAKNA